MRSSVSMFVAVVVLVCVVGSTLAAPTCTQTLAEADKDASGGLSLIEYMSFLQQEAAKNDFVIMATAITDPESPIGHLFTMLAGDGAPVAGEIDITGASATDRSQVPARQQAVLELICVKSKALIHEISSYAPYDRQQSNPVQNNPFLGENSQHQGTPIETRQQDAAGERKHKDVETRQQAGGFGDLEIFGIQLLPDEVGNICTMELSLLGAAIYSGCPNFASDCPMQGNTGTSFNGTIPDCPEFESQFCAALAFVDQSPDCCLKQFTSQIYDFVVCSVRETLGIERANCNSPQCIQGGEVPPPQALPTFGMDLDIFGNNLMNFPECMPLLEEVILCTEDNCTDFLESCRDPIMSPEANISLSFGSTIPSTCSEFGAAVCEALASLPESCCLSQCLPQFYYLAQCFVQEALPDKTVKEECFPYADCIVDSIIDLEGGDPNASAPVDILLDYYFDFFGTILTADNATSVCLAPANKTWACIQQDCPNFLGSCLREFLNFPWSLGPEADSLFVTSQSVDLTPEYFGCANMTGAFCELFNFPESCCMSKCIDPLYDLAACMADFAIGDNSDLARSCPAPVCPQKNETAESFSLGNILVSVNSSFLISTLEDITAAILQEDLQGIDSKYVKVLQEAYLYVVEAVADVMAGGSERRHLFGSSNIMSNTGIGLETNTRRRRMQEASPKLDPSSVEVYKFVDSPCDATAIGAVSRQSETTQNCISVFGKYSLLIDPEENPIEVYNQFMAETTTSISEGKLQESLQAVASGANKTTTFPFVIEGISPLYDSTFVPIQVSNSNITALGKNVSEPLSADLVATDDSGVTASASSPANGSLASDAAATSTVPPTNGSLMVLTMAPSSSCPGLSKLSWLGLCFGAVWLSGV